MGQGAIRARNYWKARQRRRRAVLRAHKIRIYPNNEQETYLRKACGAARFAYNWATGH
ncbi:MAG: helix-turn-helix domain-containing protein [Eubacteriaceae bacterium]|nr:helix-turn-helix domain-containing protein [Eubacteriaceae bacterium]